MIKIIRYVSLILISFAVSHLAQDTTEQNNNPEEVYKEYRQISDRLENLQKLALSDIELARQTEEFSKKVELEILKQNPSVKEKLDRRDRIVDDYEAARTQGNQSDMLKLQQEFQSLSEDILIYQKDILENNSEVKNEGEKLEKALFDKMKELDPEVPDLVARLETLGDQIRGIEGSSSYQ